MLESISAALHLATVIRRLALLPLIYLGVLGVRASSADECKEHPSQDMIGLYVEWSGVSEEQARLYDQEFFRQLTSNLRSDDAAVCTMTKVIFTPLRETDLYDQAKVRGMLTNERLLSNEQTFLKKLEERHIKLLVFVKLDAAPANLSMHAMVVRLDDAKQFPPDGFQTAVLLGKRNEDFEELALNRAPPRIRSTLSELTQPPQQTMKKIEGGDRFLVLIACFREYTGQPRIGSLPVQYWKTEIPARLADELRSEKDQFPDKLFVVQFEGGECPRKDDDIKNWLSKNFSNYPDQHWFAWFGSIYSYGTNNVVIGLEFVHFVKENRWSKTEHMVDETGRVMEMPKRIAEFTKDKWEAYLQYVAPVRPEVWPLPGRMAGPR